MEIPPWLIATKNKVLIKEYFDICRLENPNIDILLSLCEIDVDFCVEKEIFFLIDISKFSFYSRKICLCPPNCKVKTCFKSVLNLPESEIIKYNKLWRINSEALKLNCPKQQYIVFIDHIFNITKKAKIPVLNQIKKDCSYDLDSGLILYRRSDCNFLPFTFNSIKILDLYCQNAYNLSSEQLGQILNFCISNSKGTRYINIDSLKMVNSKDKYAFALEFDTYKICTNNEGLAKDIEYMIKRYIASNEDFFIIPTNNVKLESFGGKTRNSKKEFSEKNKTERIKVPSGMRHDLWAKYFEKIKGNCHSCEKELLFRHFEAGHVISVAKGGSTTLENLRPICFDCNRSMSTMDMVDFIKKYYPNNKTFKI